MVRGANSVGSMQILCVLCHLVPLFMVSSVNTGSSEEKDGVYYPRLMCNLSSDTLVGNDMVHREGTLSVYMPISI